MKKYSKYKKSGVPWIGEIPEEWEVKKLQYILKYCYAPIKTGPFGSDLKNSDIQEKGEYRVIIKGMFLIIILINLVNLYLKKNF